MFDTGSGDEADAPAGASGWSWPGRRDVAGPAAPPVPDIAAVALVEAVDALLAQDVPALPGPLALERCRTVLRSVERLGVVTADALSDVGARELWATDGAGSLSGWLRQQPCGDGGRSVRARRLAEHAHVRAALAGGALGVAAADVLCKALADLPESTADAQVAGVLSGAVPDLLSRWTARNALDPPGDAVADARAAHLQQVLDDGLAATGLRPADRLEPAFVLLGQALAPTLLASQLQVLVDALQPEQLAAAEQQAHDDRSLVLRKKKLEPGWRLRGELTDEVGARLQAELDARAEARTRAEAALRRAAAGDTGAAADAFGTVGPGTPGTGPGSFSAPSHDQVLDGPPLLSDDQLAHDLLGELLDDLTGLRRPGVAEPAVITITADLEALEGRFGSLPGTALLPTGPTSISVTALRRAGCDSRLNAVLLDAARTPVGASGTHRHATERERRAMRARWGHYCAGNGCASTRTVPHHVRPWWKTGRTELGDLVPLCKGNHHDVHDGHRTLRLRDGRLIDENGWAEEAAPLPAADRRGPTTDCPDDR
jgi:hypothetical protein